jgi:DNA polymerase (family 10)
MSRQKILDELLKVSKMYKENDNSIKSFVYYNAYFNLKNGIDKGIGKSITEFINNIKKDKVIYPKDIQIIPTLKGFSVKTMKELKKKGYDTPKKIMNAYINGKIKLTNQQIIGLKYNDKILKRIPRSKIKRLENKLKKTDKNFKILGSYSRGSSSSGDIDLLIYGKTTINSMLEEFNVIETIAKGKNRFMGLIKLGKDIVHLDIVKVLKDNLITAILYFSGPASFNIYMRNIAKDKGYKLSRYGLFDRKTGKKIKLNNEKDLFKKLGMKYIPVENR